MEKREGVKPCIYPPSKWLLQILVGFLNNMMRLYNLQVLENIICSFICCIRAISLQHPGTHTFSACCSNEAESRLFEKLLKPTRKINKISCYRFADMCTMHLPACSRGCKDNLLKLILTNIPHCQIQRVNMLLHM